MSKTKFREERIEKINKLYQYEVGIILNNDDQIITDIISKLDEIDEIISSSLINYTIDRLSLYDKSIIRYSIYEMKYLNTPIPIAINEAIEITKIYTDLDDERQHKFTNRLLDNIKDKLWAKIKYI